MASLAAPAPTRELEKGAGVLQVIDDAEIVGLVLDLDRDVVDHAQADTFRGELDAGMQAEDCRGQMNRPPFVSLIHEIASLQQGLQGLRKEVASEEVYVGGQAEGLLRIYGDLLRGTFHMPHDVHYIVGVYHCALGFPLEEQLWLPREELIER
eukprot:scaffold1610_cov257-Pinguiococcus_pyrenoidosus.AAC.37